MADTKRTQQKDMASWKPGSEPEAAGKVGSPNDFGVPAGQGPTPDRDYVSENTRRSDRGATQARAGENDGTRTSGAGAQAAGVGSSSGGDVDTDVTGVGFGTVAQSGPGGAMGAGESDGSSDEFAAKAPTGEQTGDATVIPAQGRTGGTGAGRGTTVQMPGERTHGRGADAASNPGRTEDDSFRGELSSGEASGDDAPIEPSSDSQGTEGG